QRFYDEDMGRFLSEDPNGLLGTNPYRYAQNNPKNVIAEERKARDGLEAATWFFAGMSDKITLGLTRKMRQGMGTDDVVAYDSSAYRYGGYAGQAVNIGLSMVNPAGVPDQPVFSPYCGYSFGSFRSDPTNSLIRRFSSFRSSLVRYTDRASSTNRTPNSPAR